MRMDDLISKRDALDKVHKTIENLILRLPTVRGVDGEDYCADPKSLAAYNVAYKNIRREIESIQPWNTEKPELNGEYIKKAAVTAAAAGCDTYREFRQELALIEPEYVVEVSRVREVLLEEFGTEEMEAVDALMERMK